MVDSLEHSPIDTDLQVIPPSIYVQDVQFNDLDGPASRIRVQLRDQPETLTQLETMQPLFFNLLKEHFDKAYPQDKEIYSRFIEALNKPRETISDEEWLMQICTTFLKQKSRLRQMFRGIVQAIDVETKEIIESGDEFEYPDDVSSYQFSRSSSVYTTFSSNSTD